MSVVVSLADYKNRTPASPAFGAAAESGVALAVNRPNELLSRAIQNHMRTKNACADLGHYQAQIATPGFYRPQDMDTLLDLFLVPVSWDGKESWDVQCLNRHAVINVFNALLRSDSRLMSEHHLTRLISVLARDELAEHEDKWILATLSIVAEGRGNHLQDSHIDALETFALTKVTYIDAVDKILKTANGHLGLPPSIIRSVRPA